MTDLTDIFVTPLRKADPLKALKSSIEKNEDEIMDLNRRQLDRGLDSEGGSLGKYKNFKYKNRYEPVDLKLTGDFRNKFSLQVSDKETEIFSQDAKEAKLKKKYGKAIFGISAPLIPNMQTIIENDFIENVQKQLT
jgi:hypothetical protein